MKKSSFTLSALLFVLFLPTTQAADYDTNIHIHDPWIREAPPNAKLLACYMLIENQGQQQRTLTNVSSASFDRVEIHLSEMHAGMTHMQHQKQLQIPKKSKLALKPGGLHLMLINRKVELHAGDKVELTLIFANGEFKTIIAEVRKMQN